MALSDIQHIVVLVMENRSFDHMLGYLSLSGGRKDIDGLRGGLGNPEHRAGAANMVSPVLLTEPIFTPGPHHEYSDVARQIGPVEGDTATMMGFVDDYAKVRGVKEPKMAMGYYDASTVWFYDFLAREYLVCDRWFSAFPGPTQINRAFLLAGHSANKIANVELIAYTATHRLMTVFDQLSHACVSWGSYFHDAPALRSFAQFSFSLGHISQINRFYEDARAGTLPSVSWIDPNFELQGTLGLPDGGNDDHPPADVRNGQRLVSKIYEALSSNVEKWKETLFIITYDEHGGFYDHVEPPIRRDRAPFRKNALFDRFGVRVPAFLISPWVERRSVCHLELEHTSIAKTILQRFCPNADLAMMGDRLAKAPSLGDLLAATARTDVPPAPAPIPASASARALGGISATPVEVEPTSPSELQTHLHTMRMRLLGEGMPPGTV